MMEGKCLQTSELREGRSKCCEGGLKGWLLNSRREALNLSSTEQRSGSWDSQALLFLTWDVCVCVGGEHY